MLFRFKHLTFPLRSTLVTSVAIAGAIMFVVALGSIGIPAYSKAKRAIQLLWEDIAKQVALTATQEVLRYFQNAPVTLKFISGLVEEGRLGLISQEMFFDICYQALKENPNFMTVYYSKIDGTFYGVFKIDHEYIASFRTVEGEGKTRVRNFKLGPKQQWVLFEETVSDYDPRKRPFWKAGVENPEGGWSDPYQFVTTKATGYSYVLGEKIGEQIDGYWAIDFQIDQLSAYLRSLTLGKEGMVYIVANDGTRIAQSNSKIENDVFVKQAWAQYNEAQQKTGFLNVEHRIFYANHFPKELQIPWSLVTSIHEDDYLEPIRNTVFTAVKVGIIPCIIFMFISTIFFGRISRRLKEIASEMHEVGNLSIHFYPHDKVISRIREVNVMNHALNKMKIGLKSFSKYVPLDLIKKMVFSGHSAELGGEKKEVTVLFADMVQFTAIAERLEPSEITKIIEAFLTAATLQVHKEKGIVDKFMGDAVMALWGAPEGIENPELAACRAALALQKEAGARSHMDHKIGINSGEAIVGNFGSNDRMDFTAIGDVINIGARLEKLNKHYQTKILLGPNTAKAVQELLLVRPLDWVVLQGRIQPLLIYELLGDKKEASHSIQEGVLVYTSGLQAYRNRQFVQAAEFFEKAKELFGGIDIPSTLLAERCRTFQQKSPPADWNGTEIFNL